MTLGHEQHPSKGILRALNTMSKPEEEDERYVYLGLYTYEVSHFICLECVWIQYARIRIVSEM